MLLPSPDIGALVYVNNVSSTEFTIHTDSGKYLLTLPAGLLYIPVYVSNPTTYLEFRPIALVISTQLPNTVSGIHFEPREPIPPLHPVAITRTIEGSVAVTSSVANELQGSGQLLPLSEVDLFGVPTLVNPTQGGTTGWGAVKTGGQIKQVENYNADTDTLIVGAGNVQLSNVFGVPTINPGVAGPVAKGAILGTNNTAVLTVVTYTPTVDGYYLIAAWCRVNNSVSGNNIAYLVTYNDAIHNVSRTHALRGASNLTDALFFSTSIANGIYAMDTLCIVAKAGTPIQVTYRDPTNVPSDDANATIVYLCAI